jgi:hypothetical protein
VAANLVNLVRALQWVRLQVDDGTIVIEHVCGSEVRMRVDGNIDAYATRNILTQSQGVIHLNPEYHSDDLYTNYEDLNHAFPERFAAGDGASAPAPSNRPRPADRVQDWS